MAKTSTALAITETHLPDYMNQTSSRGNENVGGQLVVPQIKQLQRMSHEVDKYNAKFIEGAEPGNFLNVLTGQVFKDDIYVININFSPFWQVKTGYGVNPSRWLGKFRNYEQAVSLKENEEDSDELEIAEGHTHLLAMVNPEDGTLIGNSPFIFDFAGTKLRVSKQWNSRIAANGGDRFSSVWKLTTVSEESRATKAQFLNLKVDSVGWAMEDAYKACEKMYEAYAEY